jgi:cytochrome c oxidase cbb3-type subunit 3
MSDDRPSAPKPAVDPDRLLEHNYDGIQEYDNPMPRWWVYIFWGTIVWSILYFLNVPGVGSGKGRIANYERDMEAAHKRYASTSGTSLSDDALWAIVRTPARLKEGEATFKSNCVACHREDAGGQIGPNLTDVYWIHGGRPTDLLRTVTEGVPDKGMPSWGQLLKPDQVSAVVGYVLSLRGTHPANPKEPQGVNADSAANAQGEGGGSVGGAPASPAGAVGSEPQGERR